MSPLFDLPRRFRSAAAIRRPRSAAPGLAAARRALRRGARGRRALVALVVLGSLLGAGYFFWLRDSSLVAVEEVSVSGLTSEDAAEIRSILVRVGQRMTALHVDDQALERAVARFPEVRALEARGDFPSGLRITVSEHRPAAVLVSGESRVAVAGDGTVLSGLEEPRALPEVRSEGAPPAKRLGEREQLAVVSVLGGVPTALRSKLERGGLEQERGVVVQVTDGPELVFGSTAQTRAKWAAAARVLADEDSAGAEYIDLTIPERPAAGGLAVETVIPVAPAGEEITPLPGADPGFTEPQP